MSVKSQISQIEAPLPLSTLKAYAREIFEPIRRGESVSTIWPLMAGRRVRNKFIITYPHLFEIEVGDPDKYLLVYIEPLELTEESSSGYIKLLTLSILESCKEFGVEIDNGEEFTNATDYPALLEKLSQLIKILIAKNREVVLFVGEFDELKFVSAVLYNNLKSLWNRMQGKLHFVFLLQNDIASPEMVSKFGELNALLLKNVVYVPLVDEHGADYLIDYFAGELKRPFTDDEKKILKKMCGGHPYLLKACTRLVALMNGHKATSGEVEKMLFSHFEPRSACQKIFDLLTEVQKSFLKRLASGKMAEFSEETEVLKKLGLVHEEGGRWVPFSTLFALVIGNGNKPSPTQPVNGNSGITFEQKNGAIFIGNVNVEDKFTRQEYEILRFFLAEPDKLRSRDEIGEAMWGKLAYDKYSDWAIDQVMSKIRKKLDLLGAGNSLTTVRGRGYKLNTS